MWLTVKEASGLYNIKESTLYLWAEKSAIPHYKLGKLIRFKKEELDDWFSRHKIAPVVPEDKARAKLEYKLLKGYNSGKGKPGKASERRRRGAV